jgi:hypothetical protein
MSLVNLITSYCLCVDDCDCHDSYHEWEAFDLYFLTHYESRTLSQFFQSWKRPREGLVAATISLYRLRPGMLEMRGSRCRANKNVEGFA